jgi:hypothetical protein
MVASHTLARFELTVYDRFAGVTGEIDESVAGSPPPPARPPELAEAGGTGVFVCIKLPRVIL